MARTRIRAGAQREIFWQLPPRGVKSFIIEHQGFPIGYIQYYNATTIGGGWWEHELDGAYGIDIMIGEESVVGKGNGPKIIDSFISFLRQREPGITSVIIDPEPTNARAIKAFEKAGFIRELEINTPNGIALLMRLTLLNP